MSPRTNLQHCSFALSRPWFWLLLGALFFLKPAVEAPPVTVSAASSEIPALLALSAQASPVVPVPTASFPLSLVVGHVFLTVFPVALRAARRREKAGTAARQGTAALPRPPPAG